MKPPGAYTGFIYLMTTVQEELSPVGSHTDTKSEPPTGSGLSTRSQIKKKKKDCGPELRPSLILSAKVPSVAESPYEFYGYFHPPIYKEPALAAQTRPLPKLCFPKSWREVSKHAPLERPSAQTVSEALVPSQDVAAQRLRSPGFNTT